MGNIFNTPMFNDISDTLSDVTPTDAELLDNDGAYLLDNPDQAQLYDNTSNINPTEAELLDNDGSYLYDNDDVTQLWDNQ